MSHVHLKYIKEGTGILTDKIFRLKSISLYDSLPPKEEDQELGQTIFETLEVNSMQC